jgi:protein TonB
MTAKAVVLPAQYGMRELRLLYKKYASVGLTAAIVLHLLAIGTYYLVGYFSEEEEPVAMVRIMKYSELGPPPSMTEAEAAPQVAVSVPVARPTVGVPVPVPDAEVSPEQTIATQQELSAVSSPVVSSDASGGPVNVEQDIKIEDEPDPSAFIPVEKNPVPVKQVQPEYPEIARRAGVEGTVWVKVLVDKEGKAKKAIIMKSDAEIFNDPAIEAAKQWVFTPAIMNNGPVAVWAAIPFRFKLNK